LIKNINDYLSDSSSLWILSSIYAHNPHPSRIKTIFAINPLQDKEKTVITANNKKGNNQAAKIKTTGKNIRIKIINITESIYLAFSGNCF